MSNNWRTVTCYLYGKVFGDNRLHLRLCICHGFNYVVEALKKEYNDAGYTMMDAGGDSLNLVRGHNVNISIYVKTLDGFATSARVEPPEQSFSNECFEKIPFRAVNHFCVIKEPPIPRGTIVICKVDNGESREAFKSQVELRFGLEETKKIESKTREATNGEPGDSSNKTIKVSASSGLDVVLLCSEWGSSKGGMSSFNRYLAINLAKQPTLRVWCLLSEVSEKDKMEAADQNVKLIMAQRIPGLRDQFFKLHRIPPEIPSPDVVITHGRQTGPAGYSIKKDHPSCKWIHFVHVDCQEMGKHKEGDGEYAENNEKHLLEVEVCEAADVVVAVGKQLQDSYNRSLNRKSKKVEVFYPGLIEDFQNLSKNRTETEEFHVYIFGRGSEEDFKLKGFDVVANAVGELVAEYKVFAVGVPSGNEKMVAHTTVGKTAITNQKLYVWEYCRNQEILKNLMCKADLVVMPSRAEAFGLIGLEAVSAGIPVLVSLASGFGKTLKELKFEQLVVESDKPKEWAGKIKMMKEMESSVRDFQVQALRTKYGEKYKWNEQCSNLVALFKKDLEVSGN